MLTTVRAQDAGCAGYFRVNMENVARVISSQKILTFFITSSNLYFIIQTVKEIKQRKKVK